MADPRLKRRIRDFFRKKFVRGPGESVRITDGSMEGVHVEVVSHQFDGKTMIEKHDLTWAVLQSELPPEVWGRITLIDEFGADEGGNGRLRPRVKRRV